MVEEPDHLLAEDLHRVVAGVRGLVALAVAEEVDQDHPVPAIGERVGERVVVRSWKK